ncbi:MAG: ATP-binding cassette domain-containing protein, partial [Candidatus Krumholzibacteriia bacterium]
MTGGAGAVVLRLTGLAKAFPGVQALRGASLEVRAGEVHALVGENGAGKSTLLRIVTGAHAADRGLVELDGAARRFAGPREARRRGVAAIYQELSLVPALSARANLCLGVERRRGLWLDEAAERREAAAALTRVGATCDPDTPVRDLSLAAQQLVEIARALLGEVRLLILDE